MSLNWLPARIGVAGLDGVGERSGQRAECPTCCGRAFALFTVGGHADLFLQCSDCGTVCRVDEARLRLNHLFEMVPADDVGAVHPSAVQEGG